MRRRLLTPIVLGAVVFAPALVLRAGSSPWVSVTLTAPNGGEILPSGQPATIAWTITDPLGYTSSCDVFVSFDGGAHFDALALEYLGGSLTWFVQNRPTTDARIRIVVRDIFGSQSVDETDAPFTIVSAAVGRAPTTLRDFDLPGSQPLDVQFVNTPVDCSGCHGDFDPVNEPYFNWKGGMMAYASIDPLFHAAFEVAQHDAPESGDLCLRCHVSAAWLGGRSQPTDGSQIRPDDRTGVSCDLCHRLVDPFYEPGVSPDVDLDIIAALRDAPVEFADGQYVVDPSNFRRRGPRDDAFTALHDWLPSPFHRDSALCATCHEVSNPVFSRQPDGTYAPNAFDAPPPAVGPHDLMPEQRTYSEWFFSAFNTPQGVYAPQFGGNREYVSTCQHCHMPAVNAKVCVLDDAPVRQDHGRHDLAGGATWMLSLIPLVDPTVDVAAIQAGIADARYMLQNAASVNAQQEGEQLTVRVTNHTGHKLPTGYPEGRRMWLNVRFFDADDALVAESGAYDPETATLTEDAHIKVYEARLGVAPAVAPLVGLPAYTEFHLVLNSVVIKDNRIPPLGFSNVAYEWFGGAPVGAAYPDGQNWDVTSYAIPAQAVRAEVRLFYQSVSREYVESLRDNGAPGGAAEAMYNLWAANGKSPPELMASAALPLSTYMLGDTNCDGAVNFGDIDPFVLALSGPAGYAAQHPDCDIRSADINRDGAISFADIDPFVACLSGACP